MTRRNFLASAGAAAICSAAPQQSQMAVEGYIFQQYAQSKKTPLAAVIGEALAMARKAGFRNIELNTAFFAPPLRGQTLSMLRSEGMRMPSVYVGGPLHERE